MKGLPAGLALTIMMAAANAVAAPQSLMLTRANMLAETHSHALIMSFSGVYQQLSGTLVFDPAAQTCSIDATFIVDSLTAPNALIRGQMMSKKFLDPVEYPSTRYAGICHGNQLIGELTLRGQTHPFDMNVAYIGDPRHPAAIHAQGIIDRYEWGLDGMRMTVGRKICVTNDIALNGQVPVLTKAN